MPSLLVLQSAMRTRTSVSFKEYNINLCFLSFPSPVHIIHFSTSISDPILILSRSSHVKLRKRRVLSALGKKEKNKGGQIERGEGKTIWPVRRFLVYTLCSACPRCCQCYKIRSMGGTRQANSAGVSENCTKQISPLYGWASRNRNQLPFCFLQKCCKGSVINIDESVYIPIRILTFTIRTESHCERDNIHAFWFEYQTCVRTI